MKLTLRIWRQEGPDVPGKLVHYDVQGLSPDLSILDALDILNERLIADGERPVAFDSDCREGICGACGIVIGGLPHGPRALTTSCELTLRAFHDGAEVTLEPFRATGFPLICDLVVDRSAFDRIIAAGGYVSIKTGSAPEANTLAIAKETAEHALDAAACIGCGACVAACPNGSAALFTGAKIKHLGLLPQGGPERDRRALAMVRAMDAEGFGGCSLHAECEASCPKGIGIDAIARMNKDFLRATLRR